MEQSPVPHATHTLKNYEGYKLFFSCFFLLIVKASTTTMAKSKRSMNPADELRKSRQVKKEMTAIKPLNINRKEAT